MLGSTSTYARLSIGEWRKVEQQPCSSREYSKGKESSYSVVKYESIDNSQEFREERVNKANIITSEEKIDIRHGPFEKKRKVSLAANKSPLKVSDENRIVKRIFFGTKTRILTTSNSTAYKACSNGTVWICPFCFKYYPNKSHFEFHEITCFRDPPGELVNTFKRFGIWKIEGVKRKEYCFNLCKLSTLFMEDKATISQKKVTEFDFYLLTQARRRKDKKKVCKFIGYFSKPKEIPENNISCLLVLPTYRGKGFGKMLINFAYELSRRDKQIASPERPLSKIGKISFLSYWSEVIKNALDSEVKGYITLKDLAKKTYIREDDLLNSMESFGSFRFIEKHKRCFEFPDIDPEA